jgi:large subunit ribosomal protein L17
MRHQKKKITLDRKVAPRKALIIGLAESLILHEKIRTTKAKARAVKSYVEKLVTVAKKDTLAARRDLISKLHTDNTVKKMMEVLGPRYKERRGGYTRLTTLSGVRKGDAAEEAVVEFIK